MSYDPPIIHHDFNATGTNKGTLGNIYDIDMTDVSLVTDKVHVQKGSGALYTGELGQTSGEMNDSNATFTSSSNGFFISLWVKHDYDMTQNAWYPKKTRAELLAAGYDEARLTASPNNADYVYHVVNSMYFKLTHGTGSDITQYGYHGVIGQRYQSIIWSGATRYNVPIINIGFEDDASTDPDTIGIVDGGTDFHHIIVDYGSTNKTVKIYYDNVLMCTQTNNANDFYNFKYDQISMNPDFYDTYINDFRCYNYAIDTTMLDYIYKLGKNSDLASLSGATISNLQNAGASPSQLLTIGVSVDEIIAAGGLSDMDIADLTTQIKLHTTLTISDGTSSSILTTETISPDNPLNLPNVFESTDAKTTTPQKWQDIEISSTGQYQIAVVGGYSLSTSSTVTAHTGNVWISADYGETWLEKTGNDQVSGAVQTWTCAMISADGSIMMAKAHGDVLYRSVDGGVSWTQKTITNFSDRSIGGWFNRNFYKMIMTYNGQTIITASRELSSTVKSKIIISTDGGTNWADLTSLTSDYEHIVDYHMSKSGKYILVIFKDSIRPKYSADFGATFISIPDTNLTSPDPETHTNNFSSGVCAISDNGYAAFFTQSHFILNLNSGTVTNGENDGTWTTTAHSGHTWGVSISNNGQYITCDLKAGNYTLWSNDYGATFTAVNTTNFYLGHQNITFNSTALQSRCFHCRFSDDNKYVAAIQEGDHIYVRKNTFIQSFYTATAFAAKLTTDLGNTVTFGVDDTLIDNTPYYRRYLEFANATSLTNMPKYIFNIPSSDFYVKAGGQVDFRNVNLDAEMTITANYTVTVPFEQIGDTFIGENVSEQIGPCSMSADGTIVAVGSKGYDATKGRAAIYKYSGGSWVQMGAYIDGTVAGGFFGGAIALSEDGSIVVIGGQLSNGNIGIIRMFQYSTPGIIGGSWAQIGENIHGVTADDKFGNDVAISNDGSIVAAGAYKAKFGGSTTNGTVKIYQYKIPTSTEWTSGNVIKGGDSGSSPVADKLYWTQLGTDINGTYSNEQSGSVVSLNGNGNIVSIGSPFYSNEIGRTRVFQYIGGSWSQLGGDMSSNTGGRSSYTSLSDDGNICAVGTLRYSGDRGLVQVYEYSTPGTTEGTWNQIGDEFTMIADTVARMSRVAINGDGTILVVGGYYSSNGTYVGSINIWQYDGSSWIRIKSEPGPKDGSRFGDTVAISRDGSTVIVGGSGYDVGTATNEGCALVYQVPGNFQRTKTSTLPANNYFINNFVSTIETDLNDFTLSYDADNALITFDGLAQDIGMSITSTDTTVFDTSITEITTAENTLPFITYGQPEPNYGVNGIFYGTIKIHTDFTISDGTSSSAFTTADANYTLISFASKLNTDLADNTVTFGAISGSGYLEFANATSLTGMPKYILNIPYSDFSVIAGGQVEFRNVNLDAEMTIATSYVGPFALIAESIDGEAIGDRYGYATALSADGTIMAVGSPYFKVATDPLVNTGMVQVYIRTNNVWDQIGDDIVGAVYNHPSGTNASGEYFGTSVSLSADGTILAVGSPHHHDIEGAAVVAARVYKNINNIWTPLGGDIDENMGSAGETVSLSADGNTLALSIPNQGYWVGRVKIYTYVNSTTWTQLGQDINGVTDWMQFSRNMVLSADGNTVAIGAFDHTNGSHYGRVEIRKYVSSTNTWTLVGGNIYGNKETAYFGNSSTNLSISLSTDGTIVAIVANGYPQSQVVGYTQVYEYKTPSTNWTQVGQDIDATGDIIISGDGIIVMVGANMYKYVNNAWTLVISIPDTNSLTVSARALSSDGTTVVSANHTYNSDMGFVSAYKLPGPVSTTSTIPAGDSFINNFVSKISTDINQSLSYDADNALITFDGLDQDIGMSITSTDTTVFDTSITEITTAENTLPFITYGQPDLTISQYFINGMTFSVTDLLADGYTVPQLIGIGYLFSQFSITDLFAVGYSVLQIQLLGNYTNQQLLDGGLTEAQLIAGGAWNTVDNANRLIGTSVNDYLDIQDGDLIVRNNLSLNSGDISVNNTTTFNSLYNSNVDISTNTLDVTTDITMVDTAALNIIQDISINGILTATSFAASSISLNAIGAAEGGIDFQNNSGNTVINSNVTYDSALIMSADVKINPTVWGDPILIPDSDLLRQSNNYIFPATTPVVLSNVSINSLDYIEPSSALMAGGAINQGGAGQPCVFYKYPVDENGNALEGNWIFAFIDGSHTKSVRVAFTLNGTTPSIQQIGFLNDGGTGTDYTASAAALISLYNDGIGSPLTAGNAYSLDDFSYKVGTASEPSAATANKIKLGKDLIMNGIAITSDPLSNPTFASMTVLGNFDSNTAVTSDYRVKSNVQTLDETHILDNLRTVKYDQAHLKRKDIGFLAHELQDHYPELVEGEKDGSEMQSVNYNGILPLLVNEIQILKQKIKEIREKKQE